MSGGLSAEDFENLNAKEVRERIAWDLLDAERDILYFASNCKTLDEHEKRRAYKIKYFPAHKPYIRKLLARVHDADRLVVYKSRQLIVTWTCCVDVVHEVLFSPGENVGIISTKEEAAGKVIGRIETIYKNLPEHWLFGLPEVIFYRAKKGIPVRMVVKHSGVGKEPDSVIQAAPQGSDALRSEVWSRMFWDEIRTFTNQEAEDTYASLLPAIEGGGRLTMASTPPRDPEHFFSRLIGGKVFGN